MADEPTRRATWEQLEPQFRKEWEAKYSDKGLNWAEMREAHQFGWIMARRPEFRGKDWEQVEDDLANHWYRPQLTSDESSWDIAKLAARAGWDKSREMARRATSFH